MKAKQNAWLGLWEFMFLFFVWTQNCRYLGEGTYFSSKFSSCYSDNNIMWGIFGVQDSDSTHLLMQQILTNIILDAGRTMLQTKPFSSKSLPSTEEKYRKIKINI